MDNKKLSGIFKGSPLGYALHEIKLDKKKRPVDYVFLDANSSFEKITGLKKSRIIGRSVLSLMPQLEKKWITTYGKVAINGINVEFEDYAAPLKRFYKVYAFSPEKGKFITLLTDITGIKIEEQNAQKIKSLYSALSQVNQLIIREKKIPRLFKEVCKLIADFAGFEKVCLYKYQPEKKDLTLIASSSSGNKFKHQSKTSSIKLPGTSSLLRKTLLKGKIHFYNNQKQIESDHFFKSTLYSKNIKSVISLPIKSLTGEELVLVILISEANYFDSQVRMIMNDMANDISFAYNLINQEELRKKVELELLMSESQFRVLYQNVPTGLYRTTPSGEIILANPAFIKMMGYNSLEELKKINIKTDLINPLYPRSEFKKIMSARGEVLGFESVMKKKDGSLIYFRENARAVKDKKGRIQYYEGTIEDITNARLSAEKLKKSEESYRGLFNSVEEAIYIQDEEGRFLDVNEGAVKIYGYPRNYFIGKTPEFLSAPGMNDLKKIANNVKQAFEGVNQEFEFWGKKKNGEVFLKNVRLYNGIYFGKKVVIAIAQDITEKRKSEISLLESEASYKSLIESSQDAIYVLQSKKLLLVNSAWLKMFGYSFDEVMSKDWNIMKIVAPESRKMIEDKFKSSIEKGPRSSRYEMKAITKEGRELDLDVSVSVVNWKGTPAYQGIYRDITERKRTIEQLKSKDALLEASAKIAEILISTSNLNLSINNSLGIIGEAARVSRVYIFEKHLQPVTNKILMSQRYEWTDGNVSVELGNPELQNMDLNEVFPGWYDLFSKGKVIKSFVKDFPESIRKLMEPQQIISLLLVPIFVKNSLWGFIGFDDCENERNWSESEITALSITGNTIGNAIARDSIENELRISEKKYRTIFENVQDIFYRADNKGIVTEISPSIGRYSGFIPEEIHGKPVTDFYGDPVERANLLKILNEKGEVTDFEITLKTKWGGVIHTSVNTHLLKDDDGNVIGVEGTLRDITERKTAMSQIQKLLLALDGSPASVIITDPMGIIEYVNSKFCKVTGYSREEVIGNKTNILKSGHHNQDLYHDLWATINSGLEWNGEFLNRKKNGELFWEAASISPIKNSKGEITNFVSVKEDITEKKLQLEKLLRYQSLLNGVSESVRILLTESDFEFAIVQALQTLGNAAGVDRAYIFENSISDKTGDLLMSQKYEWTKTGIQSQKENERLINLSYKDYAPSLYNKLVRNEIFSHLVKNLDKSERELLEAQGIKAIIIFPIFIKDNFWGFIGFDNVHSEELWTSSEESILVAASASIGGAIEREMSRLELIKAKEDAEKANQLKSEFLAQMSHEIRSPLNVILNFANLIKEEFEPETSNTIKEYVASLDSAGKRIIRTIDMILNMSQLHTGSYEPKFKIFDLIEEVITPIMNEYRKTAELKGLQLNLKSDLNGAVVNLDEYSVSQAIANLIDNAIKYTKSGSVDVVIKKNEKDFLNVIIKDTGIGISKEYLPSIFEAFTQEDRGYTREYDGNGLGLALVKKYCEINNMELEIDSEKGKGTTINILFNK